MTLAKTGWTERPKNRLKNRPVLIWNETASRQPQNRLSERGCRQPIDALVDAFPSLTSLPLQGHVQTVLLPCSPSPSLLACRQLQTACSLQTALSRWQRQAFLSESLRQPVLLAFGFGLLWKSEILTKTIGLVGEGGAKKAGQVLGLGIPPSGFFLMPQATCCATVTPGVESKGVSICSTWCWQLSFLWREGESCQQNVLEFL